MLSSSSETFSLSELESHIRPHINFEKAGTTLNFAKLVKATPFKTYAFSPKPAFLQSLMCPLSQYMSEPDPPVSPGLGPDNRLIQEKKAKKIPDQKFPNGILKPESKRRYSCDNRSGSNSPKNSQRDKKELKIENSQSKPKSPLSGLKRKQTSVAK